MNRIRRTLTSLALVALAGCGLHRNDALPATSVQADALYSAVYDRFDGYDEAKPGAHDPVNVIAVYRDAVESLGYSFDATVRDTLVYNDTTRYQILGPALEAIKADPYTFVKAGLITPETAKVAAATYRMDSEGIAPIMADPDSAAFIDNVRACETAAFDNKCTPLLLRTVLQARDPNYAERMSHYTDPDEREFMTRDYLNRVGGMVMQAGYLSDAQGRPFTITAPRVNDNTPFTLNEALITHDTQLWAALAQERHERRID